jgi:hypothetical protein
MTESIHTQRLTTLGFSKVPMNREARRARAKYPPSFTSGAIANGTANITYATDEVGQVWMLHGIADLTDAGFKNSSEDVRKIREAMGSIPKSN